MIAEAWATDFQPCWCDTAYIEVVKPTRLERFIRYCKSQNIGWLALALVIAGADRYEVLQTFCGIHTNLDNSRHKRRIRRDCVYVDGEKLREVMLYQGLSVRMLHEMSGVSRISITKMQNGNRIKAGVVEQIEKTLNLQKNELVKGKCKNELI